MHRLFLGASISSLLLGKSYRVNLNFKAERKLSDLLQVPKPGSASKLTRVLLKKKKKVNY